MTTHAFRVCEALGSFSLQKPIRLWEIDRFSECLFSVFTILASVSCIGVDAFARVQMPFIIFEGSSICKMAGLQRAMVGLFRFPSPPSCRIQLLRSLINYPTEILSTCRRGAITRSDAALPPSKPYLPLAV
jgi:hypothetical protein